MGSSSSISMLCARDAAHPFQPEVILLTPRPMQTQSIVFTLLSLVVISQPARAVGSFQLTPPVVALLQDDDVVDDEPAPEPTEGEALDEEPTDGASAAADDREIEVGGETVAEDLGGATGFEFPTGFYMSADLGGFVRFGGYGDSRDTAGGACFRCVPRLYSNLQPWVGINVGYDIIKNFGIEATLGNGFIGEAAPVGYFAATEGPPPGLVQQDSPENSAITMLTVALTGSFYFLDRLAIQGKGFVGGALLSPEPDPSKYNLVNGLACGGSPWTPKTGTVCDTEFGSDFGVAFGVGLGLRYATLLTDVIIGFDVNAYGVVSPNVATAHTGGVRIGEGQYIPPPIGLGVALPIIPAMSFAPVIKYVF
jgi:hypothetical protein